MRILIITPVRPPSTLGNAVTAQRYAAFFRSARWKVRVANAYHGEDVDVLVVLHARKSGAAALAFRRRYPHRALVVVLTGTDLYRDLPGNVRARRTISAATAIVTLQPEGLRRVPASLRGKSHSIVQSASPSHRRARGGDKADAAFRFSVIGHLRAEKDPLRAARAVRLLPKEMPVRVTQAGRALARRYATAARKEMQRNDRYEWLGELSGQSARRLLCSSDAMVISSIMEGGANSVCEAIACSVPILASRIAGNVGLLGRRYPGLYPPRGTNALAALMRRAVEDPRFLRKLGGWIRRLRPIVRPNRERREWIALIRELVRQFGRKPR